MLLAVQIVHIILAIALIVVVLLQSGKEAGLSGAISGGSSESFFGKNRSRTKDAILARCTSYVAILFLATSIALFFLQK
ncbi:MAG: preprotein translocase subunit SecG [Clostridia bacterium]|nr:preprotein translocase subunit SecG [Clostridia bacterium]